MDKNQKCQKLRWIDFNNKPPNHMEKIKSNKTHMDRRMVGKTKRMKKPSNRCREMQKIIDKTKSHEL